MKIHWQIFTATAAILTAVLFVSCKKSEHRNEPRHKTPHPDMGAVVVTADWNGRSGEADIPQQYTLRIGESEQEASGETNVLRELLSPDDYTLAVYNTPDRIAVVGNTASVNGASAGQINPSPGYLFASVQDISVRADDTLRVTARMEQLVRRLELELTATEGDYSRVQSATATLSGVASAVDITTGERSAAAQVKGTFMQDGNKFTLFFRLLGIIEAEAQTLTVDIAFVGGGTQRIVSDLSGDMSGFNDGTTPMKLTGDLRLPSEIGTGATIGDWTDDSDYNVTSKEVRRFTAEQLKVGDYFYSDGTWSDGGLRKLYRDGKREIANPKPAPVNKSESGASRTVIGIVFQTDSERIGAAEKEALGGTAHGLVMAIRNATAATNVRWGHVCNDEGLAKCVTKAQIYDDISGYGNSQRIRATGDFGNYPAFKAADDYNNMITPAPANTTGWYLPASGQWWDILQNLGGCPALALPDEQTSTSDGGEDNHAISWTHVGDVASALNEWMILIADEGKNTFPKETTYFWSSSEYSEDLARNWRITPYDWIRCDCPSKRFVSPVRLVLAF